jgi:hypothetical protein
MAKVIVELSEAQANAFTSLGLDTTKAVAEFAAAGVNNKLKSSVMGALKRVVLDGESQYKALSKHMELPISCSEFIAKSSTNYYHVAQSLGGRKMDPLDELVRKILSGDSAIESEQ